VTAPGHCRIEESGAELREPFGTAVDDPVHAGRSTVVPPRLGLAMKSGHGGGQAT
jgi:hypothetical protein